MAQTFKKRLLIKYIKDYPKASIFIENNSKFSTILVLTLEKAYEIAKSIRVKRPPLMKKAPKVQSHKDHSIQKFENSSFQMDYFYYRWGITIMACELLFAKWFHKGLGAGVTIFSFPRLPRPGMYSENLSFCLFLL